MLPVKYASYTWGASRCPAVIPSGSTMLSRNSLSNVLMPDSTASSLGPRYVTMVVRPSGQRILPCDVRWSTRTKCAPAPNRWSQSAMGRATGFAWRRPTPSWWTPFAQCHTVTQATKFSRGAGASDCPPGPRPGGPQKGSRKRDCRRRLREPASNGQPATGCSPA